MKKRGRQPSFPKMESEQQKLDYINWFKSIELDDLSIKEQKYLWSLIFLGGHGTEEEINFIALGKKENDNGVRNAMNKAYECGLPIYPAQYGEIKRARRGNYYKQCYSLVLDPLRARELEKIREEVNKDKLNYNLELASQLDKFPERNIGEKESVTISKRVFLENESIFYSLNKEDWNKEDKLKLWNKYLELE